MPTWWRSAAIRRCCCKPLGIRLPVYPVKGYSITVPITDPAGAPESTVMDETYKVAITRLGDRIRVGGMAEMAGYNLALREPGAATLVHSVGDLFPRRRRSGQREILDRAAADDAGRPADHRRHPLPQPVSSTPGTARWAGPWLRVGPGAGRHHVGAPAGDRCRRARHIALRVGPRLLSVQARSAQALNVTGADRGWTIG